MSMTPEERDSFAVTQIVESVGRGVSPLMAAVAAGWSPHEFYKRMSDKDFAQVIRESQDVADGVIETKLFELAEQGNMTAIQVWLFNRRPDRWSDRKRIDVTTTTQVNVAVIDVTVEAVRQMIAENPEQMAAALGPGGILDVEEAEVASTG